VAVTTTTTVDVSAELAKLLEDVGVRVYAHVADVTRPPAVIVSQPTIDFETRQGGFCAATWLYTLAIVVPRTDDRQAQAELGRLVTAVANALDDPSVPGIRSIEPLIARPTTTSVAGADLPAYSLQVRVRA
jgi:hypothetical protein